MTINAAQAAAFYAESPKDTTSVAVTQSKHQVFAHISGSLSEAGKRKLRLALAGGLMGSEQPGDPFGVVYGP